MLAPIVPPAPVRLSTTSCCPSSSLIFVATIRVIVSIEEPGVWATMTRTGRSGYLAADWAAAGSDAAARLSTEKASNALCMTDLLRGSYRLSAGAVTLPPCGACCSNRAFQARCGPRHQARVIPACSRVQWDRRRCQAPPRQRPGDSEDHRPRKAFSLLRPTADRCSLRPWLLR